MGTGALTQMSQEEHGASAFSFVNRLLKVFLMCVCVFSQVNLKPPSTFSIRWLILNTKRKSTIHERQTHEGIESRCLAGFLGNL